MSLLSLDQIKTLYNDLRGRIEANEEGTFPDMSVGSLISDEKISNSSPYLYRPVISGVGNRAYSKLIGATIANNQQVELPTTRAIRGIVQTVDATTGIVKYTGSGDGASGSIQFWYTIHIVSGHKYYFAFDDLDNSGITWQSSTGTNIPWLFTANGQALPAGTQNTPVTSKIYPAAANFWGGLVRITFDSSASNINYRFRMQVFDLTATFGSTIADYAYTLEQGQAGAGIAWLKSYGFFGKYASYDAGSLISTKAEKKKVVGFNQWDEEWEVGTIDVSTGLPTAGSNNTIRSKNFIKVASNETYYMASPLYSGYPTVGDYYAYDGNYNYLGNKVITNNLFTTDGNTCFIKIRPSVGYGATYKNDICINLSKTTGTPKNGDYVAYTSQEYDLGSDELRGLFKLDNGNLYADGDIKTSDGTITRKYKLVDMGTLTWEMTPASFYTNSLSALIKKPANNSTTPELMISNKPYAPKSIGADSGQMGSYEVTVSQGGVFVYRYPITGFADGDAFKTFITGTYLIYQLATPTTEQGTPFIDPSIVYPNGTEEYIDTRTVPVPVGNETEYTEDLKGGLETILDTPSANGTYVLKATVSGGVATLGWVAE